MFVTSTGMMKAVGESNEVIAMPMTPEERNLRRKLAGLRISQSGTARRTGASLEAKENRLKRKRIDREIKEVTSKIERIMRHKPTTQTVLDHHLAAFDSGDMSNILSDYAPNAVLITRDGQFRGHRQIKPVLRRLLNDVFSTCTTFKMAQQVVEGDVAFIVWSAESKKFLVPLATDTYLVRDGKIVVQTFVAEIIPRAQKDG